MEATTDQSAIINNVLAPLTDALTPQSKQLLANLKANPTVQKRVAELASKCNEGELTEAERAEYEAYVRVGNVMNLLRAKAKQALANPS